MVPAPHFPHSPPGDELAGARRYGVAEGLALALALCLCFTIAAVDAYGVGVGGGEKVA